MTSVYVVAAEDLAKEIHNNIPEIKFIWRLFTYDRFTEFSIFRIEHDDFSKRHENKLVTLLVTKHGQADGTYRYTFKSELAADQYPLELLRAKPKSKPRIKKTNDQN
jgi:hypothetical protein